MKSIFSRIQKLKFAVLHNKKNYECLVARAVSYEKSAIIEKNQSIPVLARSNRAKKFFLCKSH